MSFYSFFKSLFSVAPPAKLAIRPVAAPLYTTETIVTTVTAKVPKSRKMAKKATKKKAPVRKAAPKKKAPAKKATKKKVTKKAATKKKAPQKPKK